MRAFEDFKKLVIELFDFATEHEETLDLDTFTTLLSEEDVAVANETHKCGTLACVAGYAPERHPDMFMWLKTDKDEHAVPASKHSNWRGTHIVYTYQDLSKEELIEYPEYDCMKQLFAGNRTDGRLSDMEVTEERLATLHTSESYKHLCHMIEDDESYCF